MALGTMTVAVRSSHDNRPTFFDRVSFDGDANYPIGGYSGFEALAQAAISRGAVDVIGVIGQGCEGYDVSYDRTNDKLQVWRTGDADNPKDEVPDATNLSAVTFNVVVVSR